MGSWSNGSLRCALRNGHYTYEKVTTSNGGHKWTSPKNYSRGEVTNVIESEA